MRAPAVAMALLVAVVVAVVLLTVPFPVLPGASPHVDVARDFTAAQIAREQAFHSALRLPAYSSLLVSLVVAALLGLTGVGARIVGGLPGGWPAKVVLGTAVLLGLGRLATLPLDARAEVVLRRYGLSTQNWAGWTSDQLKGYGLAVGTTAVVVLVLIGLARRLPGTWWAWGGLVTALFVLVASFAYPLVVEPAFNRFTSLPAGELRSDLLALARKDDVPVKDVLVADASRRTTALNAYVSGFGSTRRIVLFDTLVRDATPREVELVVAHELGHAKRQDVLHGTIIGAVGGAAGICALFLLLSWRPLLDRAGALSAGDPRVLALVLFLGVAAPLLLSPLTNLVSRHIEARADVHALDLTGDVSTFITSERRLSTTNLSDLEPSPMVYALFFTHPSGPQRIAMAREWERMHR